MRAPILSIFILLILGASAVRTNLRGQTLNDYTSPAGICAAVGETVVAAEEETVELTVEEAVEVTIEERVEEAVEAAVEVTVEETAEEAVEEVVEEEEIYTVHHLDIWEEAEENVVTPTEEGETINIEAEITTTEVPVTTVVTEEGEISVVTTPEVSELEETFVITTIGGEGEEEGETITIEGEIATPEIPVVPVVTEEGETSVVEVVEPTTSEEGETILPYVPTVETEQTTQTTTETETEFVVIVPEIGGEEVVVEGEVTIIETPAATEEGETTVVEVVEPTTPEQGEIIVPYVPTGETEQTTQTTTETETEFVVTVPEIGAEEIVVEGEVTITEIPVAPVVTEEGETTVVEVVEPTTPEQGEIIVPYVPTGEIEEVTPITPGGETITIEGEVATTEIPVAPVVTEEGETTVVEVAVYPHIPDSAETIVLYPTGETEQTTQTTTETETEFVVTVPEIGGEEVVVEGEVTVTEVPVAPIPTVEGETTAHVEETISEGGETIVPYIPTFEVEVEAVETTVAANETETVKPIVECETYIVTTDENGETTLEAAELLIEPVTEIPSELVTAPEIPAVIAESGEVTYNTTITTTTVGGEEYTVVLPHPSEISEEAPVVVVTDNEEETYVVQVLESYETETGENVVVANLGGETVTIEGEVVPTEAPLTAVVSEGELIVVESSEVTVNEAGETVITVPTGNGETTTVVTSEVVISPYVEVNVVEAEVENTRVPVSPIFNNEEEYTVEVSEAPTKEKVVPEEPSFCQADD